MGEPNFRKLRPSRKRLHSGDIFVMQLLSDEYLFGRVIRTDAVAAYTRGFKATLVYIYRYRSDEKKPPQELSPADLLLPPTLTNR